MIWVYMTDLFWSHIRRNYPKIVFLNFEVFLFATFISEVLKKEVRCFNSILNVGSKSTRDLRRYVKNSPCSLKAHAMIR